MLTKENTEPFLPDLKRCKIIDVYDGDTITVGTVVNNKGVQYRIRMRGIDTPEIRTKNLEEKEAGYRARDFLAKHCLGRVVTIENVTNDKFGGRYLGEVFCDDLNLSYLMIMNGHARAYDGGKKLDFSQWGQQEKTTAI
jgi:endonuclease YncB( thermonuclease family)